MSTTPTVIDVDEQGFQQAVVERSRQVPVVVDFWADWCGPCRTLGPMLERAVESRGGDVVLAKVDVDRNQGIAQRYRVQGIPAVKGFRDGEVVAEFTGAVPATQIESFLDQLVPSEADRLTSAAGAATDPGQAQHLYRQALEADPRHRGAALGLARLLVTEDPEQALQLVKPHRPDQEAEALAAEAGLALTGDVDEPALRARVERDETDGEAQLQLGRVLAARKEYDEAVQRLLAAVRAGGEVREPAREQLLAIFTILGDDHPTVRAARPKLASALF